MVRAGKGKERASLAPDQHEPPETVQDARWLNGVNRQLRPDAPSQRQAASAAAAAKRKANAMPEAERKRKRAEAAKQARAVAKRAREQTAAASVSSTFACALNLVANTASLGELEELDFADWLQQMEVVPSQETLEEWRISDAYERTKFERIMEGCMCEEACTCTYDGAGLSADMPGLTSDYYDEHAARQLLQPRADDWQPSGGDWVPDGWDGDEASSSSKSLPPQPPPAPPPPPPPATTPLPEGLHPAGEPMLMPMAAFKALLAQMTKAQLEARMESLGPFMDATIAERDRAIAQSPEKARFDMMYAPYRGRIATCLDPQCAGCKGNWQHDAEVEAAWQAQQRIDKELREQMPRHLWDEHQLIHNEILDRRRCKGCGFFGCQCKTSGTAASSIQPAPDHSDAYELDQERVLEEQGRISAIHGKPYHEVPPNSTLPVHWLDYIKQPFLWLLPPSSRQLQPQRPLSPAPERSRFDTEAEFQREQARWYHEHGDGSDLKGSRREQNTLFSRLKDRLFNLRRERANPSGTPRALQGRGSECEASSSAEPVHMSASVDTGKSWEQMQFEAYSGEGEYSADMFY